METFKHEEAGESAAGGAAAAAPPNIADSSPPTGSQAPAALAGVNIKNPKTAFTRRAKYAMVRVACE